jgi:LysR family hydrogen peroxide-inducible transcriptional activator
MTLGGFSLRDLEYLVAVARCRHFGRAARHCGVSQPSLSAQIRKLEGVLGVTLFERAPGRVAVTAQGEAIVAQAKTVLHEAHALLEIARASGDELAGRSISLPFPRSALTCCRSRSTPSVRRSRAWSSP